MSKVDRLICHVLPKAFLMALVTDGRLAELQVVRRDTPSRVESVFLGRLERVMPDLDAAFVDIGIGRSGFLRAEDRAGSDDWPTSLHDPARTASSTDTGISTANATTNFRAMKAPV